MVRKIPGELHHAVCQPDTDPKKVKEQLVCFKRMELWKFCNPSEVSAPNVLKMGHNFPNRPVQAVCKFHNDNALGHSFNRVILSSLYKLLYPGLWLVCQNNNFNSV